MYRNVPQDSIEIQEMTETTPVYSPGAGAGARNGSAKNGSLKPGRSTGSLKRSRSAGSLKKGKQPRRPGSNSSENGLIYDDDDDDYDYDMEFGSGQRIRNVIICVFIAVAVAVVVIVVAVTLTGKNRPPHSLGFLEPDNVNFTDTVDLNCTSVRGIIEDDTYMFLGIPYAMSPEEERRWREPQSLENSPEGCYYDDILEADEFGDKCPQFDPASGEYTGSENCLYLNIWTPSLSNSSKLPVMVYFHGGGFMTGSGNEPGASPNLALAKATNMVYVSFNYRLNAFGFLSLEELAEYPDSDTPNGYQGNYGLLDQLMVLNWIQKNVAHFGGDPKQVTLFGQGSGATAILALTSLPETKGLFHRAWVMSPSPKFESNEQEDVKRQNAAFLNATTCKPGMDYSDVEVAACLRSIPAAAVLQALPWKVWTNPHFRDLPSKRPENTAMLAIIDGKLITRTIINAFKWRQANDVPLLIGNMAQEIDDAPFPKNITQWTWSAYDNYISARLGPIFSSDVIDQLKKKYPRGTGSPEYQLTSMVSDMRAICPLDEVAIVAANYLDSPVYRYVMAYIPTKNITMQNKTRNYAFGGLDMHSFFGAYDKISGYASVADSDLTSYLRTVVGKFARGQPMDPSWQPFPEKTNVISDRSRNFKDKVYKQDECDFMKNNAFFPEYAWMN